jgi:hypothetical protein
MIDYLLLNENYVGNLVYNRKTNRLRKKVRPNPPEQWIRSEGALEPIVSPHLFSRAQKIIQQRRRGFSDEEMLACLKRLLAKKPDRLQLGRRLSIR